MARRVASVKSSLLTSHGNVCLFSACSTAYDAAVVVETAKLSVDLKIWVFLHGILVSRAHDPMSCHGPVTALKGRLTAAKEQNGQVSMFSMPDARILASISICSKALLDLIPRKISRWLWEKPPEQPSVDMQSS